MEDFGEYVPPDAVLADGRSGLAGHNDYCTAYHRASHELTWPARGADFAQFVRCGYTGTAPYARIVWGGDPTEDDSEADGLAAAVSQGLSMGLSGIAYWGSDIGGFHSLFTADRTNAELLVRWLEVGAFSGIMRTQAEGYQRPGQGGAPRRGVGRRRRCRTGGRSPGCARSCSRTSGRRRWSTSAPACRSCATSRSPIPDEPTPPGAAATPSPRTPPASSGCSAPTCSSRRWSTWVPRAATCGCRRASGSTSGTP